MKRFFSWQVKLGIALVVFSVAIYFLHFFIFRDITHIFKFGLHELAFIPIEVLLVTLIIHQLLSRREKKAMLNKLNMVIGAFLSEVGTRLLAYLIKMDTNIEHLSGILKFTTDWTQKDFDNALKKLEKTKLRLDISKADLVDLRDLLVGKRPFLLRLLENPILLEHVSFTDLLWATFHFSEELSSRKDLNELSPNDYNHLAGDMERTYAKLIITWLGYMSHLRISYPYLYSLAVRTNPFNPQAKPEFD